MVRVDLADLLWVPFLVLIFVVRETILDANSFPHRDILSTAIPTNGCQQMFYQVPGAHTSKDVS